MATSDFVMGQKRTILPLFFSRCAISRNISRNREKGLVAIADARNYSKHNNNKYKKKQKRKIKIWTINIDLYTFSTIFALFLIWNNSFPNVGLPNKRERAFSNMIVCLNDGLRPSVKVTLVVNFLTGKCNRSTYIQLARTFWPLRYSNDFANVSCPFVASWRKTLTG